MKVEREPIKADNYKEENFKSELYTNVFFTKRRNSGLKNGSWGWAKNINKHKCGKQGYKTSKEAAVALDKKLMEAGLLPINVFKNK